MKTMKKLLLACLLFTPLTHAGDDICPRDWAATYMENEDYSGRPEFNHPLLKINTKEISIADEKLTGDDFLSYNQNYIKIEGENLYGNFVNIKNKSETRDFIIGKVSDIYRANGKACYKIEVDKAISFEEVVKKIQNSCSPLPDWMRGKTKSHYLRISTKNSSDKYKVDSDTSISKN